MMSGERPEYNLLDISPTMVRRFLENSRVIWTVLLDRNGAIRYANSAVSTILNMETEDLTGNLFTGFLTENDRIRMNRFLDGSEVIPDGMVVWNLMGADAYPFSFHGMIFPAGDMFLLIGEPAYEENMALQAELLDLNNQLTVLSRENIRKGRELAKALHELKQTQAMLVHQEKMASLGLMTAGIAHEINNPISYILSNENMLQRDFEGIWEVINTLGDRLPDIETVLPKFHWEILEKAEKVGLAYLAESVPRKITANIQGLERVKQIVLDLRNFSRLDEAERKFCRLEEGISATIQFLKPILEPSEVTIRTEFSEMPDIYCSPGPLNQAVQNVLINAIQASRSGQEVRLRVFMDKGGCCIEVADDGEGISPDHIDRVFDPFFTTKPVGSGTGLGMSIVHQVISAHGGTVRLDSRKNQGTTVRMWIPIQERE